MLIWCIYQIQSDALTKSVMFLNLSVVSFLRILILVASFLFFIVQKLYISFYKYLAVSWHVLMSLQYHYLLVAFIQQYFFLILIVTGIWKCYSRYSTPNWTDWSDLYLQVRANLPIVIDAVSIRVIFILGSVTFMGQGFWSQKLSRAVWLSRK